MTGNLFTATDFGTAFELAPGVVARVIVRGSLMFSLVELEEGASTPLHRHEEEQMGVVLAGALRRAQGGEVRTLHAGDGFYVPPYVEHGATAVDGPSRIMDVFTPPLLAYRDRA